MPFLITKDLFFSKILHAIATKILRVKKNFRDHVMRKKVYEV